VEKATNILAELAGAATGMPLSEVTRRTGLPKSTTHRLLVLLTDCGLVRHGATGYQLDGGAWWLAAPVDERVLRILRLRRRLLPHMIDLYEMTRQTVNLSVLCDGDVVHVERIYGHNRVASRSDGVDEAPASQTAAGRLLLALQPHPAPWPDLENILSAIRREGVAISYADLTPRVHCAAAPLRDRAGHPIAAIAVAGRAPGFDPGWAMPLVRRTAHAMSVAIRGSTAAGGGQSQVTLPGRVRHRRGYLPLLCNSPRRWRGTSPPPRSPRPLPPCPGESWTGPRCGVAG
jgi:DNA-binding IclR family transcriptional regulator